MKTNITHRLAALLPTFLAALLPQLLCGQVSPPGEAKPLITGQVETDRLISPAQGTCSSSPIWYRFDAPADGYYRISGKGTGSRPAGSSEWEQITMNSPTLEVYGYNPSTGQIYQRDDPAWEDDTKPYTTTHKGGYLRAGTYYFSLVCSFSFVNDTSWGTFNLTFEFSPQTTFANDAEPNDESRQAVSLQEETSAEGHLGYFTYHRGQVSNLDRVDYYRIKVPQDGDFKIACSLSPEISSENSAILELYPVNTDGSRGDRIAYKARCAQRDTLLVRGYGKGDYYLSIAKGIPSRYKAGAYALKWWQPGVDRDSEPNDSRAAAKPILFGESVKGLLGYFHPGEGTRDLADYYRIDLPDDGQLRIQSKISRGENIYIHLLKDTLDKEFGYLDDDLHSVYGDDYTLNAVARGTYYLRVSTYSGRGFPYEIDCSFTKAAYTGDVEPDDTYDLATTLTDGQVAYGHLGYGFCRNGYKYPEGRCDETPLYDSRDWYRFDTPASGEIYVEINREHTLRFADWGSFTGGFPEGWYDYNETNFGIALFSLFRDNDKGMIPVPQEIPAQLTNAIPRNRTIRLRAYVPAGSYYLRLNLPSKTWNSYGGYSVRYCFVPPTFAQDSADFDSDKNPDNPPMQIRRGETIHAYLGLREQTILPSGTENRRPIRPMDKSDIYEHEMKTGEQAIININPDPATPLEMKVSLSLLDFA